MQQTITSRIAAMQSYLQQLQDDIIDQLVQIDPTLDVNKDAWTRPNRGGGRSYAISGGDVFEKGGVNFSYVTGDTLPPSATTKRPELAGCPFHALGVSLVIHSVNPHVPASHCNVRLFIAQTQSGDCVWWFGGGYDLTPYYPRDEDCQHWHQVAQQACHPFGESVYAEFKQWCDEYFYLKHRSEARGVGGLFFDDLNRWDFETCFGFTRAVGDSFCAAYLPIVERRMNETYTEAEKEFQLYRRARYVEFNLVYDRGTLFGLQFGGRTESILVSMPPQANWAYDWKPAPGSREATITEHYFQAREWV